MYSKEDLLSEAQEAAEKVWFVQSVKMVERTDFTVSLRLEIRHEVFVHVFLGELTGSLYFAFIDGGQRIFGMDRESGEWHLHPYDTPHWHVPLSESPEPKPLLKFLSRVEDLLDQHDLL
jgi:hypothetical protein